MIRLRIRRASDHPWIFRKMVRREEGVAPGSFVEIRDREGAPAGFGLYNPRSEIALRVVGAPSDPPDLGAILAARLREAIALRHGLLRLPDRTDAYRILHAEGDALSGLVVDRLGPALVVEPYSLGWALHREAVEGTLRAAFPGAEIRWRCDRAAAAREGIRLPPAPPARPVEIREGALRFRVRPGEGHKTGFFLDQRETRAWVAAHARGLRVLDAFCYTGAFALSALGGGAAAATGVDLDEEAVALAEANARRNGLAAAFVKADVFEFLRTREETWDLAVLDPSKQARVRDEVPRALRAYRDMASLATRRVRRGGVVVACSCSGLVRAEAFLGAVREGAAAAGRGLQILACQGAAPDHPVLSACPESAYLKVLIARVVDR